MVTILLSERWVGCTWDETPKAQLGPLPDVKELHNVLDHGCASHFQLLVDKVAIDEENFQSLPLIYSYWNTARSYFEGGLRNECMDKASMKPQLHYNQGSKKMTNEEWEATTPGLWVVLTMKEIEDLTQNFTLQVPRIAREGSEGSRFLNVHFKIGDAILFWLGSQYQGRVNFNMDAYLTRINFKKNWVLDHLLNGSVSVFNRHYDDYNLVILQTVTLNENIADFITVIHLSNFNAKTWANQLRDLQSNIDDPKGDNFLRHPPRF